MVSPRPAATGHRRAGRQPAARRSCARRRSPPGGRAGTAARAAGIGRCRSPIRACPARTTRSGGRSGCPRYCSTRSCPWSAQIFCCSHLRMTPRRPSSSAWPARPSGEWGALLVMTGLSCLFQAQPLSRSPCPGRPGQEGRHDHLYKRYARGGKPAGAGGRGTGRDPAPGRTGAGTADRGGKQSGIDAGTGVSCSVERQLSRAALRGRRAGRTRRWPGARRAGA